MPRLFCLLLSLSTMQAAPLFDGGRWHGPIVLPSNPADDEWRAARTLQDQCELVTGVKPELVTEDGGAGAPVGMFVGRTKAFASTGITMSDPEGDLAVTAVRQDRVFLVGNSPGATRIAVGRFAEKALGLTFLFPGPDGCDWKPLSRVLQTDGEVFRPAFAWRGLGGLITEADEEWAFNVGYGRIPDFSHGLFRAFGLREWQEDPGLFVETDGRRERPTGTGMDPNPNLAHPRAAEIGARFARDWFHRNPQAFSVPLGVNDTTEFGDNAPASGWYRGRPVRTDYVVGFLNSVADSFWDPSSDLSGERRAIGTLAYLHTLAAPRVTVRPAVFPWVCLDRLGHADPLFAREDEANIAAWARSGARRVGVYDYWHGSDYATPRVGFGAQASAIRAARRAGAVGWYAELYPVWIFDAPKAWLGSRLLADPSVDSESELRRWFDAAYGSAGVPLREAYRVMEAAWSAEARGPGFRGLVHYRKESSARALKDPDVLAVTAAVDRALAMSGAAPGEAARRRRVLRFAEAWRLVLAYRRAVDARAQRPATAPRAVRALNSLSAAEAEYLAAEKIFNLRQAYHGQPVKWSSFVRPNPRPEWARLAASEPGPREDLAAWAAREPRLSSLTAYMMAKTGFDGDAEPSDQIDLSSPGDRSGLLKISEGADNHVRWNSEGLSVRAPSGMLSSRKALPVVPGSPVSLALVIGKSGDPLAEVVLTLKFPGSRLRPVEAVLAGPEGAELVTVVPPDATTAEYEVTFEREAVIRRVRLSVASPEILR